MNSQFNLNALCLGSRKISLVLFVSIILFVKEAHLEEDCQLVDKTDETTKDILNRISPLKGKKFQISTSVDKQDYHYKVGICAHVDGFSAESGSVVQEPSIKPEKNATLGRINATTLVAGTHWILLTYYNGDSSKENCNETSTNIMIICNPLTEEPQFRFKAEKKYPELSNCVTTFEIETNLICPKIESSLSHGSVFCILFFTGLGIYLILGFLYQRLVIGAQGMEQIPNYSFWREFGNLQADGCDFVCRCGSKREANTYRGIDDRSPREEERDDQLLNM